MRMRGRDEIARYIGRGAVIDERAAEGAEVVEVAKNRAKRAFLRGKNISSSIEMETLLYVAGVRQIAKAIEIAGVKDDTQEAYVVLFSSERRGKEEGKKVEIDGQIKRGFERISLLEVFK